MKLPLLVSTLIFLPVSFADARIASSWIKLPAIAPNILLYAHDESAKPSAANSYVAAQEAPDGDQRVLAMMKGLRADSRRLSEFQPYECYRVQRSNLKSRQTWCAKNNSRVFIFVENGPRRMSENEMQEVVFSVLGERK